MQYRGTHRRVSSRLRHRAVVMTAAIASGTLVAPLTSAPAAHAGVVSVTGYARPAWIAEADVVVNPPGPKPGEAVAPAVPLGYVITGDHLERFNITATPEGQQELRAFIDRIRHYQGITLEPTAYNVYATPPIDAAIIMDDFWTLLALIQQIAGRYTDPAVLEAALVDVINLIPRIDHQGTDDVAFVLALANAALYYLTHPPVTGPDPATVVAMANDLVEGAAARLRDGTLPFNPDDDPDEIANDITHAAPVGTDAISEARDGVLGDVVILPIGAAVGEVSAAWNDTMLKVTTILAESPAAPAAPLVGAAADQPGELQPGWVPNTGNICYDRKSNNTAWYDPCYAWHELPMDGNPDNQTWGHKQFGTAKSKGIWTLVQFEVNAWPMEDPRPQQAWADWTPRADSDHGNCTSRTIGVNVNAAYLEHSSEQCDQWDIDKGAAGGDFSNTWRGKAHRKERDVAAIKATMTPNLRAPGLWVRYDYYAR